MKSKPTLWYLAKKSARYILSGALLVTGLTQAAAQDLYTVNSNSNITQITVSGTSNIHDWDMTSPKMICSAYFTYEPSEGVSLKDVSKLDFSFVVKTLKSGKNKMDDKTYKALKAEKFSTISFKLISAEVVPYKKDTYTIHANGTLTIAGVTKQIDLTVACLVRPDGTILCTGAKKLKMTDYNVEPPTALLGTIISGDDITISFLLDLKKSLPNDYLKKTSTSLNN